MTSEEVEVFKQEVAETFRKEGSKHFLEILRDEFKDTKLAVKVSVAGKSKNLGKAMDVITSVWNFAMSNPQGFMQVMQIPGFGSSFNQLMEYAGLSPVDFSGISEMLKEQMQQSAQPIPAPMQLPQPATV